MIVYFDTSAYVKLIIEEDGSPLVRAWFSQAGRAISSVITYAETMSTLGRRDAEERQADSPLHEWTAQLEERWRRTVAVPVAERLAGRLALSRRLRGMDAVQLAAAMTLREHMRLGVPGAEVVVAAFDRRLLEAAEHEGFATLGGPEA